jgi:hypothetical protein
MAARHFLTELEISTEKPALGSRENATVVVSLLLTPTGVLLGTWNRDSLVREARWRIEFWCPVGSDRSANFYAWL